MKLKLGFDFLNNCKQLGVYPKLLIFKLPSVSNKDALLVRKRLVRSAIIKRNKQLQHVSKELSLSGNVLSQQLSTIDFCMLTRSVTSHNKESLQKSLYTQQKILSSLMRDCSLPTFAANETITNLAQYELYPRKNPIYLTQVYTFQSNQKKFENPKSLLHLKRFIVCLLITLNPRKPKFR